MPTGKQALGPEILIHLDKKFSANILQATVTPCPRLERVEIKARALAEFGQSLRAVGGLSSSQALLASATDEIFADVTCSVYLSAASLGPSAPMVLRRALELGFALVYLWDLPHLFWAWKDCDNDLSFKEMLAHIESTPYKTFLHNIGVPVTASDLDTQSAKSLYRNLSNTIHGKFGTMETLSESRYSWDAVAWNKHLEVADQALDILLNLWGLRFPQVRAALDASFPQLMRVEV
jgi:hypothetical protein